MAEPLCRHPCYGARDAHGLGDSHVDDNPNSDVMNRELEVQRDRLMDMGDWAKDGQFLGKVAPLETIQLKEKAFSV